MPGADVQPVAIPSIPTVGISRAILSAAFRPEFHCGYHSCLRPALRFGGSEHGLLHWLPTGTHGADPVSDTLVTGLCHPHTPAHPWEQRAQTAGQREANHTAKGAARLWNHIPLGEPKGLSQGCSFLISCHLSFTASHLHFISLPLGRLHAASRDHHSDSS